MINQYSSTPSNGMGGRSYYLSKFLAVCGYEVVLFTASNHHILRESVDFQGLFRTARVSEMFSVQYVKLLQYKGARSLKRVVNWFFFSFLLFRFLLPNKGIVRPDFIVYSTPSLLGVFSAYVLARRYNAKLILDVRDIWPLTLVSVMAVSERHPLIRLLGFAEKFAYRKADFIISPLPAADIHIRKINGTARNFQWIPNGFDLNEVASPDSVALPKSHVIEFEGLKVGYIGTLGYVNALEFFLLAACKLKERRDIRFYIIGHGGEANTLKRICCEHNLDNVVFIEAVKKAAVPSMLKQLDICYIGWLNKPLYKFGVGANKLAEYLYSGVPILHSYSGALDPVEIANCGISVPAENVNAISNAILLFKSMSVVDRESLGVNGRSYAEKHYPYDRGAEQVASILESL